MSAVTACVGRHRLPVVLFAIVFAAAVAVAVVYATASGATRQERCGHTPVTCRPLNTPL